MDSRAPPTADKPVAIRELMPMYVNPPGSGIGRWVRWGKYFHRHQGALDGAIAQAQPD